jgi:hypothetical protein
MREARPTAGIVFRSRVVSNAHGHERRSVIFFEHNLEPVPQKVVLVSDFERYLGRRINSATSAASDDEQSKHDVRESRGHDCTSSKR